MNWLDKLVRGSAPKAPAPKVPPAAESKRRAPAVDIDALRRALQASIGADDHKERAEQLGAALGATGTTPLPDDEPTVRAAAVCAAVDKATGLAWLESPLTDDMLGLIAQRGRFAELRLAAARRITDGEVLERIARESRHKDNNVYQHCSDILKHRRLAEERIRHAERLAGELAQLLATAPVSVSRLLELEKEALALGGDGRGLSDCQALIERANAKVLQETEERRALTGMQASTDDLVRELGATAWPDAGTYALWDQRRAALAESLQNLPPWLAMQAAAAAISEALRRVQARLAQIESDLERASECERFLAEWSVKCTAAGEPGADADAVPPAIIDAEAEQAWHALAKPTGGPALDALEARWRSLPRAHVQPVAEPPAPARPPAAAARPAVQIDLDAVRQHTQVLEQALDQGQLAEAEAAAKQLKVLTTGAALRGELDARLQRAQARLAELRAWASWGADRKRDELVAAASALLVGDHGIEHLAATVPDLRDQWKRLSSQATSTKEQWETFDAALTKAYQPVLRKREEEAAIRDQARAAKEAICAQFEVEWAAVGPEDSDLAAYETRRQQMMVEWRAAPVAGFRDERLLRKRFDTLIAAIDQRYEAARAGELARRERLISDAEALKDSPDMRQAVAQAKVLQEHWRDRASPTRLVRGQEQALWRKFRAACDAVFARRDAERAEQQAQRTHRVQELQEKLEAFRAAIETADSNELKRAMAQFRTDWDAASADGKAPDEGLVRRARDLQRQAQTRVDSLRVERYRERLADLARKAPAVDGLDAAALDEGLAKRRSLLIDLEIALGLPTPDAFSAARQQRQLEMLRGRFRSGPSSAADPEQLLTQWYQIPAAADEQLAARIETIVGTLTQRQAAKP